MNILRRIGLMIVMTAVPVAAAADARLDATLHRIVGRG
jgi:hypothetical protein